MVGDEGCVVAEVASAPTLVVSWGPNEYGKDEAMWQKLFELEMKVCAKPELTGMGHHLFCVAKKNPG